MTTYKPPCSLYRLKLRQRFSVFLAGSIEMGSAPNWQAGLEHQLKDLDLDLYNPRRDDWDPSWIQSSDNPVFREQVEWELFGLEQASLIVLYLAPGTLSPISLLEFGRWAALEPGKTIVCCPEGFYRKGNIDIVCDRYGVLQAETLLELESLIRDRYQLFKNLQLKPCNLTS